MSLPPTVPVMFSALGPMWAMSDDWEPADWERGDASDIAFRASLSPRGRRWAGRLGEPPGPQRHSLFLERQARHIDQVLDRQRAGLEAEPVRVELRLRLVAV